MDANDRALTAFAMLGHATFHTYELVIPVFVAIWIDAFTASPALLGLVAGASYGLVGVGALPSGVLADRVGSKRLVLACLVGMSVAFGLVSVAPTLPVLAVALLLWGAAASIYHPAGLALLSRGAKARGAGWLCNAAGRSVAGAVLTARPADPDRAVAARAATVRTGRERPPRRLRARYRPRPRRGAP